VSIIRSDNFDDILYEIFAGEFKKKTGVDMKQNKRSVLKLRRECEKIKKTLSRVQQTQVQVDGLAEGMDLNTNMSRARFEDLSDELFRGVISFINSVIGDIPKSEIEDIILIGGTSQIPKLKTMITNALGKEPLTTINQDEAISLGNALATKSFERDRELQISRIKTTSYTIGICSQEGKYIPFIPKNTPLPTKSSKIFSNLSETQQLLLSVYEGENEISQNNRPLGNFVLNLDEFEKSEVGNENIRITLILDVRGNLLVKVSGTLSSNSVCFNFASN